MISCMPIILGGRERKGRNEMFLFLLRTSGEPFQMRGRVYMLQHSFSHNGQTAASGKLMSRR